MSYGTIKDGQNCMAHGRPNTGGVPGVQPAILLPRGVPRRLRNKYLAFVRDYFGALFSQLQFCAKLLGIFEPFHSLW
jgi:hypothetical protein